MKTAGAAGFSYTEVLIATLLIALVLVPAIDAMHTGVRGGEVHALQAVQHAHLTGRVEQLLATPFDDLQQAADLVAGPTTPVAVYSDAAGSVPRAMVFLARYDGDDADGDGDPFTGTDDGLVWARVAIEDTPDAIETLVAR